MKKIIKKLVSAGLVLAVVSAFAGCGQTEQETQPSQTVIPSQSTETTTVSTQPTDSPATETTMEQNEENLDEILFIGDSRTMGLMEYSGLDVDFYASVGMSVYNIDDNPISVPNVGKLTLTQLLSNKSYGRIYLMVGINELGYDLDQTVSVYSDLVNSICQMQPNAKLFIQANLHVTQEKSDSHPYITNAAIDAFNQRISKLANGENIFYLNVNPEFDNEDGALSDEYTSDGVHLFAKHYEQWGQWILEESSKLIKEG